MFTTASTRQITTISRRLALVSARTTPSTPSLALPSSIMGLPRRPLSITTALWNNKNNSHRPPIDQPSTRINSLNLNLEAPPVVPESQDSIKSIDQVMQDLQRDAKLKAAQTNAQFTTFVDPIEAAKNHSESQQEQGQDHQQQHSSTVYSEANANAREESGEEATPPPQPPKKPSRFWFYLYQVIFWSAIGSIPVHLLKVKNEDKDLRERVEWEIMVLEDMEEKLKKGESVEEEMAMLTIGHDRAIRAEKEQVDEKHFEDLLASAEKLDFVFFGKDKEAALATAASSTPSTSTVTPPAVPVVPRKPAPPKTERSYL
ncbi:hypothetical protein FBU30_009748 [Linnemannia zychae]|nr:hypothetical protein FBU30_009748 [Linnemannia zychae]